MLMTSVFMLLYLFVTTALVMGILYLGYWGIKVLKLQYRKLTLEIAEYEKRQSQE